MSVRARVLIEPLRLELVKACDEVSKLKRQLTKSRHELQKLQAKRDHHLRERDRYRDLYLAELRKHTPKEAHATEETP